MAKKLCAGIISFSAIWLVGIVILSRALSEGQMLYGVFMTEGALILILIICAFAEFTKTGILFMNWLRGKWFLLTTGGKLDNSLIIGRGVRFKNKNFLSIGNHTAIGNGAEFFPVEQGHPSKIVIGNCVVIGDYNRFASMNSIVIEDNVLFAAYVHITDHSHEYRNPDLPVMKQGIFTKGSVRICKGAWIGLRVSILSGVTVGEHSVVAAGAVVTKDVPAYSVVAGCPAKVISYYNPKIKKWVKV